ncbi:hypothetical protein [Tropicimonas sediminicola]|uniref:Hemolysin-type calcium-binding repeat-containing protein n=1 Tax=Tropicimonas sediminicola TaxID=1031541 RepID=A0A239ILD5_9RHOB|nr:hypothetical protein [Tropicimonas sediminicola]SNS94395.1 hypothetical protein SAMN05421757_104448 [Tropicimonas sediminicola]
MATVKFTEAHNYHYGYGDFELYKVANFNVSTGTMKLVYDAKGSGVAFNAQRSPWKITIKFDDLETYKPENGPDAGEASILSGTVKSIRWYDKSGALETAMTKIGLDAGVFHTYLKHDPKSLYEQLVAENSIFNGPTSPNRGIDVTTGSKRDIVNAGEGGSYIKDMGGADTYKGTNSVYSDTVTYEMWNTDLRPTGVGIQVDLTQDKVIGPDGKVDKLLLIDRIIGTNYVDTFVGNGDDNIFIGLRGNDTFDGKGGFDRVQYHRDSGSGGYDGIVANMYKGEVRDGFGTTDTLKSIEYVIGTDTKDRFISNNQDNTFRGRDGKDKFIFKGSKFGSDTITDFTQSEDKMVIAKANSMSKLTITKEAGGTLVTLNDDSDIFLEGFNGTLTASDFIL